MELILNYQRIQPGLLLDSYADLTDFIPFGAITHSSCQCVPMFGLDD